MTEFDNINFRKEEGSSEDYVFSKVGSDCILNLKFLNRFSDLLVVTFSGAYSAIKDKKLPFYSGLGFADRIKNVSFLFIDDLALQLDGMLLGWYGGTSKFNLQSDLPEIIKYFFKLSKSKRIVFFGGSGGGFASLYYSSFFENSLSIIWNPQINIKRYDVAMYKVIDSYASQAFATERNSLDLYMKTNMADFYGKGGFKNKIIYLQNITDRHVDRDLKYFIEAVSNDNVDLTKKYSNYITSTIFLHLTDWAPGHRPPPREVLFYLLERLSRPNLLWPNNFSKILRNAECIANESF